MSRIKTLSPEVISLIKAGEVIEGPVSVVKELTENAIDSGANTITIILENGGKDSIVVIDNGCGMNEEDLKKSTLPHSTSKTEQVEDLFNLSTLGFRGEALHSISSVSRLTITTSDGSSEGLGSEIVVSEGKELVPMRVVGRNKGTTMKVDNLFFNVLPRKKQMKSATSELNKIVSLITKFSLIYPNISFRLENNGKSYLFTKGDGDLQKVMHSVLGLKNPEHFKELSVSAEGIEVYGFITNVHGARKNKKNQVVSINSRLVNNPSIHSAIEEGVRKNIPPGVYPQYILNITVARQSIDCNVHPTKSEVRVFEEDFIEELLKTSIRELLTEERIIEVEETLEMRGELNEEPTEAISINIIGQLAKTYIIAEVNNKMFLFDQHAAHETIIYHRKLRLLEENRLHLDMEYLDKPLVISLMKNQMDFIQSNPDTLRALGIEFEEFGYNSIVIRSIPSRMTPQAVENIVLDILSGSKKSARDWLLEALASMSCKSAIKANDELELNVMEKIVKDVIELQLTNCPHGRPLYMSTAMNDIHKKFKRIL